MRIHILGICGTFMGSLALLARELGHEVEGSDANVYPPMSTQLTEQGIVLKEGYKPEHLQPAPDLVVVGNAMSRGNVAVEYVLNAGLPYVSGPEFLARYVLQGRHVIGVAGTHGKTTTTTMVSWILEQAGLNPGFLIGGVPKGFTVSARLGGSGGKGGDYFVVEADEYDTAFFDKRSKFVHYRPRTAILNNLEYDHADIFPDLAAIQKQFHHLIRTIPGNGGIIVPADDEPLQQTLSMGAWTPVQYCSLTTGVMNTAAQSDIRSEWSVHLLSEDATHLSIRHDYDGVVETAEVHWSMTGQHSARNAVAAVAAACHCGVSVAQACAALSQFPGVKRRMELLATVNGIAVYDDFAHHPTAIATTLDGLRKKVGSARIIAVIEPRSNTMKLGTMRTELAPSAAQADAVFWYQSPTLDWSVSDAVVKAPNPTQVIKDIDTLVQQIVAEARPGDHVLVMSNGGFGGIHGKLLKALYRAVA